MPSNHLILCCPVSSCPQSFPASSSFPTSQLFTSDGESIGASASVLPLPRSTDLLRVTTNPECFIPSASLSSENCRELASIFSSQMHGCGVLEVARALSSSTSVELSSPHCWLWSHLPDFLDHDCPVSGFWKDLSPHSSRSTSLALRPRPTHLAAQSCQTSWCDPAERPWTPYAGRHSAGSVSLLLLPPSRPVPKHLSSKHPFA